MTAGLKERLAVRLRFRVYLGWITIATMADVAVALVSIRWSGLGIPALTRAEIVVMIALLLTVILTRRDVAYGLVIMWVLARVAYNQTGAASLVMLTEVEVVIVAVAMAVSLATARFARKN
jgi:hypothetical protein